MADGSIEQTEKRKAGRVHRACFNCRKRKQGCEEERPCKRCLEKGIQCVEVETKRKRGRMKNKSLDHLDSSPIYEPVSTGNPISRGSSSEEEDSYNGSPNPSIEEENNNKTAFISTNSVEQPPSQSYQQSNIQQPPQQLQIPIDNQHTRTNGLNLAQLLPFLVNVCAPDLDSDHMITGERYVEFPYAHEAVISEFPFYTNSMSDIREELESAECEMKMVEELSYCWQHIVQKLEEDENLRREFTSVKARWQEIMKCLRSLEWQKVQSYLQEMENVASSCFSSPPALVFWSSGGRIHHANESFCKLVGYNIQELRVQADSHSSINAHSLFHPDDMVALLKRQLEATQHPNKASYHLKTRLFTKYRKEVPVSVYVANLRDSLGVSLLTVAHFAVV